MTESSDREARLETLMVSYLRSVEEGTPAERDALLSAHADLVSDLEEFFKTQDWLKEELAAALEIHAEGPLPRAFGKYELLAVIGRGGMGVVYKAREAGREVALKMIPAGELASREAKYRFRAEAEAAASLDHPNIVPILDIGEHEGQHYFTMKLFQGGTLDRLMPDLRGRPEEAVRLMLKVLRAVRHAHQRGILHRDLKPGNILLDHAGEPHVADFGLAVPLNAEGGVSRSRSIVGSIPYMSPEQFSGSRKQLSIRSDVWNLGVVLYELLTGRLPFPEPDAAAKVLDPHFEPERPRVDRVLAAICLKSLKKDPARRFENTGEFSEELDRWLNGLPTRTVPPGPVDRFLAWSRRHVAALTLGVTAAALLFSVGGHFFFSLGRQQEILISNARSAQDIADRFRRQLREWGDKLIQIAKDKDLADLLEAGDFSTTDTHDSRTLQAMCAGFPLNADDFESWTILDAHGTMRARVPDNDNRRQARNFRERDYFKGPLVHAREGIPGAHVSRAFRTTHALTYNIALSVPIHRNGTVLGVLRISVSTGTTMGLAHLHDARRRVVVVAPWETSYAQDESDKIPGFRIVVHPLFAPAQKPVPIRHSYFESLSLHSCEEELDVPKSPEQALYDKGYRDPIDGGSWLAGFAPIGNTGYVVIVQQKDD